MQGQADTNATIWKSNSHMQRWLAGMSERERKRTGQYALMAQLLPFGEQDRFTVLDLGAGTGAAARTVLSLYPNARAILADFSPQMMGEGARVMAPHDGRYVYVEFDLGGPAWPPAIPEQVDAVLTSQVIHHLPDERKRSLFREILLRLVPGGWYVNFDPFRAADPEVEAVWQRVNDRLDPAAADRRQHRSPEEQAQYENHVRSMIDLDRQLGFLRAAGFEAVDVYWKQLDYVIHAGRRPR